MSRKKTTGRFDTRKELEERVGLYYFNNCNESEIARMCGISQPTVAKIIKEKNAWKKS